jgi:hypothetical protein
LTLRSFAAPGAWWLSICILTALLPDTSYRSVKEVRLKKLGK